MWSRRSSANILVDFFEITFIAVTVFVVVYVFVGQLLEVTGESMLPNFEDKEQIIAEKISVKFSDLERGEVVIFRHPEQRDKLIIKRVIGLPGETIKLDSGYVYINGEKLSEDYVKEKDTTSSGQVIKEGTEYEIAENSYIFLGDNREKSTDSRDWGAVSKDLIVGRGVLVYYPVEKFRILNR
ncbi:MAG: signal peptidase I [Patescibacteria group bacterium]